MFRCGNVRRTFLYGGVLLPLFLVAAAFAQSPSVDRAEQLLGQARAVETSDVARFSAILQQLNSGSIPLSHEQQLRLRYLNAFQLAYKGDNKDAVLLLDSVIDESSNPTLRLRALSTEVNVLGLSFRYEEAFSKLNQLLDLLPQVTDKPTRLQAMGVSSLLYTEAGQYDLAANSADQMLYEGSTPGDTCRANYVKLFVLHKSGKFSTLDPEVRQAVGICVRAKEPLFANLIRSFIADYEIRHGQFKEAITLLHANARTVRNTHYPRLISEFNEVLARAYWGSGDATRAQEAALDAVSSAIKNEYTEPLALAYKLLYQIEKQQGNFAAALDYHEKYMAADKGYLNSLSTKALAYQTVKQQVLAKKLQVAALNKENRILQLQQALSKKDVEAGRLWIILLLSVLAFIAFLTYRIKRSQLKFMRLARRDGLTGIYNRQHFVTEAERQLQYCRKSTRDACLVLIDLDHFKVVNDTFGHSTGDRVLKRAVEACQAHLRSTDIFGRLGGEEFGILLPECSLEQVVGRVEQLRLAIASVAERDTLDVSVSGSFGVSATEQSGYDLRELLIHADDALYQAKNTGRNRAVVFDASKGDSHEEMRKSRAGAPVVDIADQV
ncbi:GGDEF domain-containing protein [Rhodanobacter ginsengisoli]|uniref:diguanylate cyclase n=1 Tax=Rhodanobacter ginsengisoli TaxID=418646 RepID=A0ABW0QMB5_9GAMM